MLRNKSAPKFQWISESDCPSSFGARDSFTVLPWSDASVDDDAAVGVVGADLAGDHFDRHADLYGLLTEKMMINYYRQLQSNSHGV